MTSLSSFINGIIAGAGAVLAIMSAAFVQMVSPLEGVAGFSSTEIRVAILLGGIVFAVAVGYEFYSKKETKSLSETKPDRVEEKPKTQKKETIDE